MIAPQSGLVVVTGVADADTARPVLAQAFDLAHRINGSLVVTHVVEPAVPAAAALPASGMAGPPVVPAEAVQTQAVARANTQEQWVRQVVSDVAAEPGLSDVPWSYRSAVGDPGHTLAELATDLQAYCIVVGSRGQGLRATLTRLVRPSVSRAVLRARHAPVLVVPHDAQPASGDNDPERTGT